MNGVRAVNESRESRSRVFREGRADRRGEEERVKHISKKQSAKGSIELLGFSWDRLSSLKVQAITWGRCQNVDSDSVGLPF